VTEREPLAFTPEEEAEERAFIRKYGALAPFDPPRLAEFMAGFPRPWWIVGGWSIEAYTFAHGTGAPREHEDVDLSILACDIPAFREHVGDAWLEGTEIDYRISLRGLPLPWRSRIDVWEPGARFVDRQVIGPYRWWRHEHRFKPEPDGNVLIVDRIEFAPPGGLLGMGWRMRMNAPSVPVRRNGAGRK